MIVDSLDQLKRYAVPQAESILKFIAENDCLNLPDGEQEIKGRELFVRIMSYVPKPASENKFETHHVYADLQYIVKGCEIMQTARLKDLTPIAEYDARGDYNFFKTTKPATDLIVEEGEFAIFYPHQPHRPSCAFSSFQGSVKKLVFKIKIN